MNKPHLALPILLKIQGKNPYNYQVVLNIAQVFLQRKKYDLAESQFIRALNIDDSHARAHHGLGLSFLRRGMLNEAIEEFLMAIEHDFFFQRAHFHLGEALFRQQLFEDAANAFEVYLKLMPKSIKGQKWLAEIYRSHLNLPEKAAQLETTLSESMKGQRIICTEIQARDYPEILSYIESIGFPVDFSEISVEKASNLYLDHSWLTETEGKIVFIPSHSLFYLPDHFSYKLIYIQSEMNLSLENKLGDKGKQTLSTKRLDSFESAHQKIEAWIQSQGNMPILYVQLNEIRENEIEQQSIIESFLG